MLHRGSKVPPWKGAANSVRKEHFVFYIFAKHPVNSSAKVDGGKYKKLAFAIMVATSVVDPDPLDPIINLPPVSGSVFLKHGPGSGSGSVLLIRDKKSIENSTFYHI